MKPPEDHPEWSDRGRDDRIPPAAWLVFVIGGLVIFIAIVVGLVAAT